MFWQYLQKRFATHKSSGSSSNGRTSQPKYLGFKKMHGAKVDIGNIIIRQRGTEWRPGTAVGIGRDHTIFALRKGRVVLHYDLLKQQRFISVDDGTLPKQPSKTEMKQRLSSLIDTESYLAADAVGRYNIVMEKVAELGHALQAESKDITLKRMETKGLRKFTLIDRNKK